MTLALVLIIVILLVYIINLRKKYRNLFYELHKRKVYTTLYSSYFSDNIKNPKTLKEKVHEFIEYAKSVKY